MGGIWLCHVEIYLMLSTRLCNVVTIPITSSPPHRRQVIGSQLVVCWPFATHENHAILQKILPFFLGDYLRRVPKGCCLKTGSFGFFNFRLPLHYNQNEK